LLSSRFTRCSSVASIHQPSLGSSRAAASA
jgi:hypothetical protein